MSEVKAKVTAPRKLLAEREANFHDQRPLRLRSGDAYKQKNCGEIVTRPTVLS